MRWIVAALALIASDAAANPAEIAVGRAIVWGHEIAVIEAATACDPDNFERRRYGEARTAILAAMGTLPPAATSRGYRMAAERAESIARMPAEQRCAHAHLQALIIVQRIERQGRP